MRLALTRLVAFVAALLVVVPCAFAQSLDGLRASADASRDRYEAATEAFMDARAAYDALVATVEAQKDDVLDSPIRAIELQASLRRALETSESVAALDAAMRAARDAMRDDLVALHDALDAELTSLGAALDDAPPAERRAIADEVQRLVAELDATDVPLAPFEPVPLDAILADLEESSDALRAAADELADNEDRLARHLETIRGELDRVEAREALRERATRMAVEDRFFDDGVARRPERATATAADGDTATAGGGGQRNGMDSDEAAAPTRDDGVTAGGAGAESDGMSGGGAGADDDSGDFAEGGQGFEGVGDPGAGESPPGGIDVPVVTWDTEILPPVTGDSPGIDPTLLDRLDEAVDGDDRRRRRGRAGDLRALEAEVQQELQRLRVERERVEAEAAALEDAGF